jgi:predicted TIM-barrel fold metal-dependent hydrolase
VAEGLIIDASVHPNFRFNAELREYLPPPWRNRGIPDIEKNNYSAPGGDYAADLVVSDDVYPASDPEVVSRHLFDEQGVDIAILLPLTRGNNPDRRLASAICAAVNDWQADRWLGSGNPHGRFRGTIRVNPNDPEGAVREIERWADHPLMVQVGVPMEARDPYGKPQYWPVWEAAARHRLPVVLHVDGGAGADIPPTPAGSPRTYAAFAALSPVNGFYHLLNLIAEGVFERLRDLVFVLGDGGSDVAVALLWRYDMFWRAFRDVTPWSPRRGSDYVRDQVRFLTSRLEGPHNDQIGASWWAQGERSSLMLYASHYPHWSLATPQDPLPGLEGDRRQAVLGGNAAEVYRIAEPVTA